MRILILGASGMLGSAVIRVLSQNDAWEVYGTVRAESARQYFREPVAGRLLAGVDVEHVDTLMQVLIDVRPDVVVNCIGLVKQLAAAEDPLLTLPVNALLPHRLSRLCKLVGARLIHVSTDCVFSGDRGGYRESDTPDARDLYGRSKLLGEVADQHALTLRTSIIGHELRGAHGLIDWFLAQQGECKGYTRAIFSGLTTHELARVVRDVAIPQAELHGVYHVASEPISKYDLLRLVARIYGKQIEIRPCSEVVIDRSLDASGFRMATGYAAPSWPEMIQTMYENR